MYTWTAACIMMVAIPAFACQPPRDMPRDPQDAKLYWERARDASNQRVVTSAPTLMVARASATPMAEDPKKPGIMLSKVALSPVKVLRTSAPKPPANGIIEDHWCNDFKIQVRPGAVHLVAMDGTRILMAEPLANGDVDAAVRAFGMRIGVPDLVN